ncbi:UDP-galactose transporter senju-like [Octopus vulgaris]|uniref:UDP-galactose transporter senju-like n=2 Tax=Octopus TaxID=6643 RepID=A0AA36AS60_OCTVU|nr:UDP-galactose transporter senju-like [Octopus sinensis]CAI9720267.1 UDP-galactose transporter senju-like [Octopus vulgaris]
MESLCSAELFPTKCSFVIFLAYMGLFINQGILVTSTKTSSNTYAYNTITVVLFTEFLKLLAAMLIYLKNNSFVDLYHEISKNKKVFLFYFVPAALYSLYNNLQFVNLVNFDPTTYYLLLQFRVVVTGILFQILFNKRLRCIQWVSVILLTIGCLIKELGHVKVMTVASPPATAVLTAASTNVRKNVNITSQFGFSIFLIMIQVFSSCFAGVYNEYLLKDKACNVHIMVQNIFMYIQSIICNGALLIFRGELVNSLTLNSLMSVFQVKVMLIMLNNASIGIVVSLFLHSLNSILKTFASALELVFTAILCWIIFNIPIDVYTIGSIFIVTAATFMYALNPVVNRPKNTTEKELQLSVDEKSRDSQPV